MTYSLPSFLHEYAIPNENFSFLTGISPILSPIISFGKASGA